MYIVVRCLCLQLLSASEKLILGTGIEFFVTLRLLLDCRSVECRVNLAVVESGDSRAVATFYSFVELILGTLVGRVTTVRLCLGLLLIIWCIK